jgi:hypothetical protein
MFGIRKLLKDIFEIFSRVKFIRLCSLNEACIE